MNREVGQFLLESWQLFYWSFFCPSLLQQRINEWTDEEPKDPSDTSASEILLVKANFRFILQHFFVSAILSLPLAILVALSGRGWDYLLCLTALLINYGLAFWFRQSGIGFCSHFLFALMYWQQAGLFAKAFQSLSKILPSLSQLFVGICIGGMALAITTFVVWRLKQNSLSCAYHTFWIGSGLSVLIGSWIASQNCLTTVFLAISIGILAFLGGDQLISENIVSGTVMFGMSAIVSLAVLFSVENIVANVVANVAVVGVSFGMSFGVAIIAVFGVALSVFLGMLLGVGGIVGGVVSGIVALMGLDESNGVVFGLSGIMGIGVSVVVAGIVSFGVVVGVTIVVSGVAIIPLPWFLLTCALVAFGCAPLKRKFWGIWIAGIFVLLGWENLTLNALWAVPVSLVGYYRIFPDYLFACPGSSIFIQPLLMWFSINPNSLLTKLPPYTTELLWLPVPNHARILSATFHENTDQGLSTFQKMQAISLPGFKLTIKNALPAIVADRFTDLSTTLELIESVTPTHPLFPILIPAFYQFDESVESLALPKSGNSEIDILFPILQQTAKDTTAALQSGSSALRERSLERLVDKLKMLIAQLPGLGLKPQAVKRWQPAIERWQEILELEIAEQQKTSQGELLNPFQFGNPLRPDRAAIFKGRQDFADRLVRLILDRNRPTLVLHGPRRAGKTSFLLNLPRLLPSDLVPIYLDMQQGSMTASEGDFCYGLVRAIDRDTRSQGLQLPPIPSRSDFAQRTYPTLEDWLDLALPRLGDRRLLLNLDEFEKIGSAIKDGLMSERLFDQLRSMIQHYDRLGFLFSGVQTLEELGPRWSNYFISVVPMEMHYLEPHEAEDLLLNPDPEFTLRYDDGIVAEILRLTRCQPYLLQLIGSAVVTQANLQHTQLATTALLQAAIQDAFTNGEPYFTNIWTEFTGTTPSEVTDGQNILISITEGNPYVETIDETIPAARRRLLRYHVIERDGDIDKIEIPLFEQWVRERAIET